MDGVTRHARLSFCLCNLPFSLSGASSQSFLRRKSEACVFFGFDAAQECIVCLTYCTCAAVMALT